MKKKMKENKPAQSFRLGAQHRDRLEELARYRDEAQVEVLRVLIDVAFKIMIKRKAERKAAREAKEAREAIA